MKTIVFVDSNPGGLAAIETAKRMGFRAVFVKSNRFAPLYSSEQSQRRIAMADRVISIDDCFDPSQLDAALLSELDSGGIDALVTVLSFAVVPLAEAARRLGLRFTNVEAVRAACSKNECRKLAERHGLPPVKCVETRTDADIRAAVAQIGFPVLIKPAISAGSMGAHKVRNAEELDRYFVESRRERDQFPMRLGSDHLSELILVEEFIEGPLISVEIGRTVDGTIIPFVVGERTLDKMNPVLELGTTMPALINEEMQQAAIEQASLVIRAIGLDIGIFHIEFIASSAGPRLVEVNPRIMGGNLPALFGFVSDEDLFEWLIRIHLGENPKKDRFTFHRSLCSRLVAADKPGYVQQALATQELQSLRARTVLFNLAVLEGQPVEEYSHTFNGVGHFVVGGEDPFDARRKAEEIVGELSGLLGLALK